MQRGGNRIKEVGLEPELKASLQQRCGEWHDSSGVTTTTCHRSEKVAGDMGRHHPGHLPPQRAWGVRAQPAEHPPADRGQENQGE